ncbi:MAG: sodium-dependent transporter [Erysipelotrichia bacterium]|nr:sodium-dependent transporter [Erysipelotrichia bacterium]
MENTKKRSSFSGKLGYVMAVAGSAVGLGNIWRFPYLAAKYGGGIFLLTYLVLALTFGFALLISETALGRKTGKSPIQAFKQLAGKKLRIGGWLNAIIPMLIIPYYCVVGGWVCKYLYEFGMGNISSLIKDDYFSGFISAPTSPILWLLLFALLVFIVVMFGVEKGVERVSKILMPALVVMAIIISIYSVMTPGALEGVKYYLIPDFSRFSMMTVVAAMGQMFYSLSIGMGILYTYGSYMKKDIDMESSIGQIEIMDTGIAFLAGLMIIPAVFAFSGGNPETLNAGASLMFITMPKVFGSMALGNIIAFVFFLLVLFAALTSAISLMECCVSTLHDQFSWSRKKGCIAILLLVLVLGIPCSLGFGILDFLQPLNMSIFDFFDFMTNSIMMPISAIFTCVLIVKVIGLQIVIDEVESTSKFKRKKVYVFCMKYIVIFGLLIILISSVLNALGIITM